ncbi:hypothetical protein [Neopusillimonas aromaticivorans]|uniref:hypothetical protein n=1 Tax=Neopusillimonas aromaticivorans TaxID=2979868 RepID=UPI0025995322|nr:hypothetical protein [Neopusillimonas aromaticivorans]WJJ93233.1 hypothetical protein N7E01_14570 [Neopusillimonas aromaticivorans]
MCRGLARGIDSPNRDELALEHGCAARVFSVALKQPVRFGLYLKQSGISAALRIGINIQDALNVVNEQCQRVVADAVTAFVTPGEDVMVGQSKESEQTGI